MVVAAAELDSSSGARRRIIGDVAGGGDGRWVGGVKVPLLLLDRVRDGMFGDATALHHLQSSLLHIIYHTTMSHR